MPRRHLNREDLRLKIQQSHHSNPPQFHNQNIQTHNQAHRLQYHPIHIDRSLEFIYHIEINHNLPPPNNRDQASYLPNAFAFLNAYESFQSDI